MCSWQKTKINNVFWWYSSPKSALKRNNQGDQFICFCLLWLRYSNQNGPTAIELNWTTKEYILHRMKVYVVRVIKEMEELLSSKTFYWAVMGLWWGDTVSDGLCLESHVTKMRGQFILPFPLSVLWGACTECHWLPLLCPASSKLCLWDGNREQSSVTGINPVLRLGQGPGPVAPDGSLCDSQCPGSVKLTDRNREGQRRSDRS